MVYLHEPYSDKRGLNSLPNNNSLDWTKFNAVADNKFGVAKIIMISVFNEVKNIVGKGENAG